MARPMISAAFGTATIMLFLALASAQRHPVDQPDEDKTGVRLKRSQVEEILKADRAKSIEDAGQLVKLSEQLQAELEKNGKSVLSVAALRKTEEIEKLAKRIRGRLRRY